jgi:hypothetical protein
VADLNAQAGQLSAAHYALRIDVISFCESDFIRRLEVDPMQLGFITGLNVVWATEEHGEAGGQI